jgi:hypothetical protein
LAGEPNGEPAAHVGSHDARHEQASRARRGLDLLPFALIPLTIMTSRESIMGALVNRHSTTIAAITITVAILALNGVLLAQA